MSAGEFVRYRGLSVPVKPYQWLSGNGDWITYKDFEFRGFDLWQNCENGKLVAVRWRDV